jgi:hypothetical protein
MTPTADGTCYTCWRHLGIISNGDSYCMRHGRTTCIWTCEDWAEEPWCGTCFAFASKADKYACNCLWAPGERRDSDSRACLRYAKRERFEVPK